MRHHASVLVVETDPSLLAAIGSALSRHELEPVLTPSVDAALDALSGGCAPDCIVVDLDLGLPPVAPPVVARLHAHPGAGDVPVLAVGSRPGLLMSCGADAVMLKPLDLGALPLRIAGICDCAPMQ